MKPLYFIIGCPRSGTYLLSNILDQSGQIAIPTETHFIPLFDRYVFLAGNIRSSGNARARLLKAIYAFLEIWLTRAEMERRFSEVIRHSLLVTRTDMVQIIRDTRSYAEAVHAIYESYAASRGAEYYGDKSAFFRHIPLERIDHAVNQQAKFIHIVRDGRDVCLSWMKLSMGPENLAIAARAWRDHIARKRQWGALHSDRYCEIRYEDLLKEPERETRRICEFIGIGFKAEMLQFHRGAMAQAIANSSTHAMLGKPIDSSNSEKWRSLMAAEDIAFFEWLAGEELAKAGYPLTTLTFTRTQRFRFICRDALARIRAAFSYRAFRLMLKNMLPTILLLASYLGIRVESAVNSKAWMSLENKPIPKK